MRSSVRRSSAVAAAFGGVLVAAAAAAHEPFSVTTEARALPGALTLHVTMAGRTATLACPAAAGEPHRLTPEDVERGRGAFEACAKRLYVVTSGGHELVARAATVALTEEGDFDARVTYPPAEPGPLLFEAVHLSRFADAMYGAELTVTGERVFLGQALLRASAPSLLVAVPAPATAAPGVAASGVVARAEPPRVPTFGEYVRLGAEHLLRGYDHLAFLVGLFAVSRRLTRVLAVVTAFTLAHSVSLALAVLGVLTLPGRVVEPLIAATLVLVAVENWWRPDDGARRWALAFAFGLVHGLGFAGALVVAGLGQNGAPLALPLFGFNLGLELAQAVVAAAVVPLLLRLRGYSAFERYGPRALSLGVGILGLIWLVTRLA